MKKRNFFSIRLCIYFKKLFDNGKLNVTLTLTKIKLKFNHPISISTSTNPASTPTNPNQLDLKPKANFLKINV